MGIRGGDGGVEGWMVAGRDGLEERGEVGREWGWAGEGGGGLKERDRVGIRVGRGCGMSELGMWFRGRVVGWTGRETEWGVGVGMEVG